jgi:hypothetical protein
VIRKDLACAKSFRTPAEALAVLTYIRKGILSDHVKRGQLPGNVKPYDELHPIIIQTL